jgi:hypothetical protein
MRVNFPIAAPFEEKRQRILQCTSSEGVTSTLNVRGPPSKKAYLSGLRFKLRGCSDASLLAGLAPIAAKGCPVRIRLWLSFLIPTNPFFETFLFSQYLSIFISLAQFFHSRLNFAPWMVTRSLPGCLRNTGATEI